MATSYEDAKRDLFALLRRWEGGSDASPASFTEWLHPLQQAGWTRAQVHRLVWDVLSSEAPSFSSATMDELGEVETALSGYCHPSSVIRFPGDPKESDALSAYVLGGSWKAG